MLVRLGSFLAMVLVAAVALASCGSPNETVKPTVTRIPNPANAPVIATGSAAPGGAAPTAASANPPMTIDLTLEDIKFDKTELTVPANTQITVNLKNAGAAAHNFNIDDLNVHSGDIPGGGTGSVTFNSGPAGTHEYYCNIPGHKEAGMDGKLTVTANAESGGNAGGSPSAPAAASPIASPVAGGGSAQSAPETTFNVELRDIAFSLTTMEVPANTQITVNLTNVGSATHNFNIDELNAHSGDVPAGGTGSVTFNSGAPGTYTYYCNIPGHKEAGMVGKLTVVAGGGATTAPPQNAAASPAASAASPVPSAASPAPAASGGQTTFDVGLKDIAFEQTTLEAPANTQITIKLTNHGAATHNFNIDELNVHSGDVAPGASTTVTFTTGAAGTTYQYYCNIPGHKEAGMVGTLTIK